MSKAHAQHNEALCHFLLEDGRFNDWVVTSAFYSALHFAHNELFPLTENEKIYENFDIYFNYVLKNTHKSISKHQGTIQLVKKLIPESLPHYRWLYDACMNARYSNYKVSDEKSKRAKKELDTLKKYLKK